MDAKFKARRQQLLDECVVRPELFDQVVPRLEVFMAPFLRAFCRKEQVGHALTYVQGLLSDLDRRNIESIAYRFGHERMPLQWFVGVSSWNDRPLREELVCQVGAQLGEAEGVIVFDPSAFPKSGRESVGVARQWCGRLGKVENCQVAVYMGYVSSREHTLVDMRLYLPKAWAQDKARRKKAGVPPQIRYQTRHKLCLEMLKSHGHQLPHAWIAGDDEMGRPYWFRRRLSRLGERYLLAVPSKTLIRDLEQEPPPSCGRGPRPKRPWQRVEAWTAALSPNAWTRIDVRDGAKGPLVVDAVKCRVAGRTPRRQQGQEEVLVVLRYRDRDNQQVLKTDYYLSNAPCDTPLREFARVAKAEHRIEECLQRGKSEAGLGDYEVRKWKGWQHHQTLSLIATWFLVVEARRGKKIDACDYAPANPRGHRPDPARRVTLRRTCAFPSRTTTANRTQPSCPPLSLEST